MTDSGGSTRSTLPFASPRETPPHSPQVRSSHSSSPSAALSPLPPLPTEVFSLVLSFLDQQDLERCLLVSRSWHTYVEGNPSLWHTVEAHLDLDDQRRVNRICGRANVNGRRSTGGIRTLKIVLRAQTYNGRLVELITPERAEARLGEVLASVFAASVLNGTVDRPPDPRRRPHSTVTTLTLSFRPNTFIALQLLHKLGQLADTPLFANLKHLNIYANLPHFQLRQHVLRIFPQLSSLHISVVSASNRSLFEVRCNNDWTWQPRQSPALASPGSLDRLRHLALHDVWVSDLHVPLLPQLKHLDLHRVTWEGRALFYLLRIARTTLETLSCIDLRFEQADDEFEDWQLFVDVRDQSLVDGCAFPEDDDAALEPDYEPAPIVLSSLRTLHLAGKTLPLFVSLNAFETTPESELLPTPSLFMPALTTAILDEITLEPENGSLDDAMSPLAMLGRLAPQLRYLDVRSTSASDVELQCCLTAINGSIHHLDISETMVSDHLIVRLPNVAPELKVLDVRNCGDITCQGVARAVEVIRMRNDEGLTKVESVFVSPPENDADPACWLAYRWLDYVGVLRRDEYDFEGDGPVDSAVARRRWIKQGKEDAAKEFKVAYAVWEREQQEKRLRERAALLAVQQAAGAVGTGGSASRAGLVQPSNISLDALAQISQTQQHFQQLALPQQQPHAPLPAGFIPPRSMAPSHPQQFAYSSADTGRVEIPLPLRPAPPQPPQTFFPPQPPHQLPSTPQLPPLAPHQQPQYQQQRARLPPPPPPPPPAAPAASDTFDITCLDSLESFDDLDPAFLAEQQKAMEQAMNRNSYRLNAEIATAAAVERSKAQDAVYAAAHQQHEQRAANVEQARREYAQRQVAGGFVAAAAAPASTLRTAQDNAHLQALRSAHGSGHSFSSPASLAGTPMQMTPRMQTPASGFASSASSETTSASEAPDGAEAAVRAALDEEYDDPVAEANGAEEVNLGFAGDEDDEDEEEVVEVELEKVA
ncbi:hypothetical protein JCM6882_005712 [Rhodosporidiobolus microsporus]